MGTAAVGPEQGVHRSSVFLESGCSQGSRSGGHSALVPSGDISLVLVDGEFPPCWLYGAFTLPCLLLRVWEKFPGRLF